MAVVRECAASLGSGVAANTVRYSAIGDVSISVRTVEAEAGVARRSAGTISNLLCNVSANTTTADSTIVIRIPTGNGNEVITVGSGATGQFEDTSNTDVISAGTVVSYGISAGVTGTTLTISTLAILFNATLGTVKRFSVLGAANTSVDESQFFQQLAGSGFSQTVSRLNSQQKFRTAGTLKNFFVYVSANARLSTTTFGTEINAGAGNQTLSVALLTTGVFEDTSNTDTIASGDLTNYTYTTGVGTGEILVLNIISVEFSTTRGTFECLNGSASPSSQTTGATNYFGVGGRILATTAEADVRTDINIAFKASNLRMYASTNSHSTNSTLRLRVDGNNGNQVVTLTAGVTGWFEDTVNSDKLTSSNQINTQLVVGTGGALVITSQALLGSHPIIGPFPTHFNG